MGEDQLLVNVLSSILNIITGYINQNLEMADNHPPISNKEYLNHFFFNYLRPGRRSRKKKILILNSELLRNFLIDVGEEYFEIKLLKNGSILSFMGLWNCEFNWNDVVARLLEAL